MTIRACCPACAAEIRDPFSRRYRYPYVSCAACGPLVRAEPPCAACAEEGGDRRCYDCGPRAELVRADGAACSFTSYSMLDDVDAVRTLVQRGNQVLVEDFDGLRLYHAPQDEGLPVTPLQLLILARLEQPVPIALVGAGGGAGLRALQEDGSGGAGLRARRPEGGPGEEPAGGAGLRARRPEGGPGEERSGGAGLRARRPEGGPRQGSISEDGASTAGGQGRPPHQPHEAAGGQGRPHHRPDGVAAGDEAGTAGGQGRPPHRPDGVTAGDEAGTAGGQGRPPHRPDGAGPAGGQGRPPHQGRLPHSGPPHPSDCAWQLRLRPPSLE